MQASTDGVCFQSFIDGGLQFHFFAATPAAVSGDHDFAVRIVDAIDEGRCWRNRRRSRSASRRCARRPALKSPAPESAACRARRDRLFRRRFASGRLRIGRLRNEVAGKSACAVAGLAFPNQRRFVASPGCQMPIETVVRNIDLAADKPLSVRRRPVQNRVPFLEPMQLASAMRAQKPSGSALASARSASSSAIDLMWAFCANVWRRRKDAIFVL